MKEIRIPIANFKKDKIADVNENIVRKSKKYEFRFESIPWEKSMTLSSDDHITQSLEHIFKLRNKMKNITKT